MQLTTEAVVLRTIQYSDTSLICRLFTRSFGKVTVMAKGARRPKNPMGSILEPLTILEIMYYHKSGRDIQILSSAQLAAGSDNLRESYQKLTAGLTMVDMLDRCTRTEDPHPVLYRLITAVLKKLGEQNTSIFRVFDFFLYQLTVQLGFRPELEFCPQCRKPLTEAVFSSETGELSCRNCSSGRNETLPVRELQYLQQLSSLHLKQIDRLSADTSTEKQAGQFLVRFLSYHVDELNQSKSIKIFHELLNQVR